MAEWAARPEADGRAEPRRAPAEPLGEPKPPQPGAAGAVGGAPVAATGMEEGAGGLAVVLLHAFAWAYAMFINHLFLSFGTLFLLQAFQAGRELKLAGGPPSEEGLRGLVQAARLLFGNFVMPFSETVAAAAFPSDVLGIKALGFWVPTLLGIFIISTATLGHLCLKRRRSAFVLPYVALAVVQLVWQIELSKVLRQVASAEDLAAVVELGKNERMQSVPYAMFEAPYETFVSLYTEQRCSATLPSGFDEQVRLECENDGLEGKVLQFAVAEFCRARSAAGAEQVQDFGRRVEACKRQGREAKILPTRVRAQEAVFCRCRSALYDWFRFVSRWIMVVWCAELVGVCTVLYFGVEANLAKMDPVQRREVVGFAVVGVAALAGRVTVFADYFDDVRAL